VILDTKGNSFSGFTPVEWESVTWDIAREDDSLKSFIFTLKNLHNISARRFMLKAEQKGEAITGGIDMRVSLFIQCRSPRS
jgi:hypothetical protein